jgi:cytochrome c oxidase subunit 4
MAQAVAHKHPNYMAIFWWLAILTVVELAVIFLPLAKLAIGVLLCALALGKASLVAMYFMHLRFETRTLGWIAITPLMIGLLLILLLVWDGNPVYHTSGERPTAASSDGGH